MKGSIRERILQLPQEGKFGVEVGGLLWLSQETSGTSPLDPSLLSVQ